MSAASSFQPLSRVEITPVNPEVPSARRSPNSEGAKSQKRSTKSASLWEEPRRASGLTFSWLTQLKLWTVNMLFSGSFDCRSISLLLCHQKKNDVSGPRGCFSREWGERRPPTVMLSRAQTSLLTCHGACRTSLEPCCFEMSPCSLWSHLAISSKIVLFNTPEGYDTPLSLTVQLSGEGRRVDWGEMMALDDWSKLPAGASVISQFPVENLSQESKLIIK